MGKDTKPTKVSKKAKGAGNGGTNVHLQKDRNRGKNQAGLVRACVCVYALISEIGRSIFVLVSKALTNGVGMYCCLVGFLSVASSCLTST